MGNQGYVSFERFEALPGRISRSGVNSYELPGNYTASLSIGQCELYEAKARYNIVLKA
jgi:hypothetical protein